MRLAFISEGTIDEILVPPLIRCILGEIDYNHRVDDIDFEPPIHPRKRGFGWVLFAVKEIVKNIELFRESYDLFILLVDRKNNKNILTEIEELIKGHDDFILAFAKPEVEAWVVSDTENVLSWLKLPTNRIRQFPCLVETNYEFERDQDYKIILTEMIQLSNTTDYESWVQGAAEEFIDGRWAGEGLIDYYSSGIWTGNANLNIISNKCPQGFLPLRQALLKKFVR